MSTMQLYPGRCCWAFKSRVCRTVTNLPQVAGLRFINLWEAKDEDGLSQTTLQPNNKESLVSPTHPILW